MASTRFKNAIASKLAKLVGGDVSTIARAIDRPKVKGHGTFAVPLPRILPPTAKSRKGKGESATTAMGGERNGQDVLARLQHEVSNTCTSYAKTAITSDQRWLLMLCPILCSLALATALSAQSRQQDSF